MEVHYHFDNYKVARPVITSGVFDGVHKGHVQILSTLKKAAERIGGESVVVTFWPHPKFVVHSDYSVKLLNTIDEKIDLLAQNGIDHLVVFPFTEEFSNFSAEEYVAKIIVEKLRTAHIIMGFNHHFGKGREGNFDTMNTLGEKYGFTAEMLPAQIIENEKVSSTFVRQALVEGDVCKANMYLGYNYMISGKVVEGKKLGRTIGFPTANVQADELKLIPKTGVYSVDVLFDEEQYLGILNIGSRPTVNSDINNITIEVHLLNFDGNLYGKTITLRFLSQIRDEKKFDSLDDLKKQIEEDKMLICGFKKMD